MNLRHPRSLVEFLYARFVTGFELPSSVGLDDDAIRTFRELLDQSSGYLEFGSGGSTAEAARLGKRAVSVEADRHFAEMVREALPEGAPVEVMHIDIGMTRDWSRPAFIWPTSARLARWRQYSRAPFERLRQLGWFPDFVLVDGRFRRACALETARRAAEADRELKLLFDDYGYKGRGYPAVEEWLGCPRRIGRAALFEISVSKIARIPTEADVAAASRDYE